MNKNLYSTALAIMMAGSCLANDVPMLTIQKTNGESNVVLSELLSIKYTDSDMVINMKNGTQLLFAFDDVLTMVTGLKPTAINSIFSNASQTYLITDLQGKVVLKGKSDKFTLPTQKGAYIISVGNKSKVIIVK